MVAAAQRAMPKPLGGATLSRDGEDWMFSSPALAKGGYRLFPEPEGWFDAAAQQTVSRDGAGVSLRIPAAGATPGSAFRSEEHTSEIQSLMRISYAVFSLQKKTI